MAGCRDVASTLREWLQKRVESSQVEINISLILQSIVTPHRPAISHDYDLLVRLQKEIGEFKDGNQPDHKFAKLVILAGDAARHLLAQREEPPPVWAEKLLHLVLSTRDREALPGDLEEEFRTIILPKFGYAYARKWYWTQVLRSVWPLARGLAIRIAACAGIWKAIEVALRKIGL